MRTMLRGLPRLIATLGLGLVLVACGSGADASGGTTPRSSGGAKAAFSSEVVGQQVAVSTDPSGALKWTQAAYEAAAGDVTFVVTNPGPVQHNFVVEGDGLRAESPAFKANSTNNYTLKGLAPGEYRIVCTLPGHREAGMVATLTVR